MWTVTLETGCIQIQILGRVHVKGWSEETLEGWTGSFHTILATSSDKHDSSTKKAWLLTQHIIMGMFPSATSSHLRGYEA